MARTDPAPVERARMAAHPAILLALAIGVALGASLSGGRVADLVPAPLAATR